jgi:hypothetical protein
LAAFLNICGHFMECYKKMEDKSFYLLGEMRGTAITIPQLEATEVTEFLTIGFPIGGVEHEAVAVFMSKLDAEICRQYLNRQNHEGSRNTYELLANTDSQVQIIKKTGNRPARLVVGFVLDQTTRKLVVQGGLYSLMHFDLHATDQDWLLNGGQKPAHSVMESVRREFLRMGEPGYQDELAELEKLDEKSLISLAKLAVLQVGALPVGNPTIPAVFSPRRQGWAELQVAGRHGTR